MKQSTETRLTQMLGDSIISIAENWEQLSADDLKELIDLDAKDVSCVYESWRDLAAYKVGSYMTNSDYPMYLLQCIDIDKLADYLKAHNTIYTELKSGKVVEVSMMKDQLKKEQLKRQRSKGLGCVSIYACRNTDCGYSYKGTCTAPKQECINCQQKTRK